MNTHLKLSLPLKAWMFIPTYNMFWSNLPPSPALQAHCFPSQLQVVKNFFFFKFNVHQIHLLLPVCAWVWDHLLEYGRPPEPESLGRMGLLPLAGEYSSSSERSGASEPFLHLTCSQLWLAGSHVNCGCPLPLAFTFFSVHPFWDGYWTSGMWYRCPT